MILTGEAIKKEMEAGSININPYCVNQINPNDYNYRLGFMLKIPSFEDDQSTVTFAPIKIPDEGYVLEPGQMNLGSTYESIGSSKYAMPLIGRSSMGRCGLFL